VVNLDEFDNVGLVEGTAEAVLPTLDFQPDAILIDPPRSGMRPQARDAIVQLAPEIIIYVSCNPSTLARDTRSLYEAGYQIRKTVLVDMFPQTYHMESVVAFTK
jgi:23S rRNA (uracil1939-C5)-methyltransferase